MTKPGSNLVGGVEWVPGGSYRWVGITEAKNVFPDW